MAWCARCPRCLRSARRRASRACRRVSRGECGCGLRDLASIPNWCALSNGALLTGSDSQTRGLLRPRQPVRPPNVATRYLSNDGTATLSRARILRYSIVVRTTEQELLVDQEDSDQRIIQRVLAGDRDEFTVLIT